MDDPCEYCGITTVQPKVPEGGSVKIQHMSDCHWSNADYVYRHCATCGTVFGVVDPDGFGPDCLGDACESYDIDRDPTYLFAADPAPEGETE